jgi:hypothetical protein
MKLIILIKEKLILRLIFYSMVESLLIIKTYSWSAQ